MTSTSREGIHHRQFCASLVSGTRSLPLPVLYLFLRGDLARSRFDTKSRFMIDYTEKEGKLTFRVKVSPRALRSEVVGEHDGLLRVRVAAPPVDGAANEELVRTLAKAFGVSRGAVEITVGLGSKLKNVSVTGQTTDLVATLNQLAHSSS